MLAVLVAILRCLPLLHFGNQGRFLLPGWGIGLAVGVLLLQAFLRHVEGRSARVVRVLLPPLVAVAAGVTVVALTVAARALYG